jgi:hypothetical protein
MPRRQPRWPSIGLNSCSSSTRCDLVDGGMPDLLGELLLLLLGVRQELVQRRVEQADGGREALERLEDAGEVLALVGQQLGQRLLAVLDVVARIISRMASMRSPSKNMCSVRVRPMPVAPKATAMRVCSGVSALVRTASGWPCAHHSMSWRKFLNFSVLLRGLVVADDAGDDFRRRGLELAAIDDAGGAVDGEVVAFLEGLAGDGDGLSCRSRSPRAEAPQMQTLPIWRATSAACEETPPLAVRMPSAAIMPRRSSGEVSLRTSSTFSPFSAAAAARSALR